MPDLDIMRGTTRQTGPNPVLKVAAALKDPDSFATTLLVIALDAFGPECLNDAEDPDRGPWHPTTFRTMLEEKFGVQLPQQNLDKLMAAVTVVTTDLFFTRVDRFIVLANILAGDEFDPGVWEKADSVECAWAITEALLLDPPDEDNPEPFSDEIRLYVGMVLRDEGYVTPPDVLKIALDGDFSDKVRYGFSDDPEMFEGIYAVQQEKAAEVESILRDCLLELSQQLKSLPVQEGSTDEVLNRIGYMLKLNEPEESDGPDLNLM